MTTQGDTIFMQRGCTRDCNKESETLNLLGNDTCIIKSDCCKDAKNCNNKKAKEEEPIIKNDVIVKEITSISFDKYVCNKGTVHWIVMFFRNSTQNSKSLQLAFQKV